MLGGEWSSLGVILNISLSVSNICRDLSKLTYLKTPIIVSNNFVTLNQSVLATTEFNVNNLSNSTTPFNFKKANINF